MIERPGSCSPPKRQDVLSKLAGEPASVSELGADRLPTGTFL